MSHLRTGAAIAAAALLIAGCGGDDEGDDAASGSASDLATYLPTDTTVLSVVDFDEARSELGLDADADVADPDALGGEADDPELQLANAALTVLPPLRAYAQTLEPDPVLEALDGTAISAAAGDLAGGPEGTAALRTTQSFDDLAETLEGEGYELDGDTLTNPDGLVKVVADAGDGTWVLGGDDAAAAAGDPPGGPEPLVELLSGEGPSVGLATSLAEASDVCLTAFGGRQNADGSEGEFLFEVDGDAELDRVDPQAIAKVPAELGEPTVDGSTVAIPFSGEGGELTSPIGALIQQFTYLEVYDCG